MRRLRVTFLSFMLLLVGMSVFVSPVSAASGDVCVANVNGIINPAVADYLTRSVKLAEQEQCNALIVKLNTPGGLTSSTWQIGEAFLNANVPIVVYATPNDVDCYRSEALTAGATDITASQTELYRALQIQL